MHACDRETEVDLARFNRFIREILDGQLTRNTFRSWEVQLLLDLDACQEPASKRTELLRRYQKAVQSQSLRGTGKFVTFGQFLERRLKRGPSEPE